MASSKSGVGFSVGVDVVGEKRRRSDSCKNSQPNGRTVLHSIYAAIAALSESTESECQQLEQQRAILHVAIDDRVNTSKATLRNEHVFKLAALEKQAVVVEHAQVQGLDVAPVPSDPVELPAIVVQSDMGNVLRAIHGWGVVCGAHVARNVFDAGFGLLVGRDGVCNATAAFALFQDAAAQGNTTAQGYVAILLYLGFGVAKDKERALDIFDDATRKGDVFSRAMTALRTNPTLAFELLTHAAARGHVAAEHQLAICNLLGVGCKSNPIAAAHHFLQSATQGYAHSKAELATLYENGVGVSKDLTQTFEWTQRAALQGCACAEFNLGTCYDEGLGVDQNPVLAVEWYQRAAAQGNVSAQYNLALCYSNGSGVEKNWVLAAMWWRRAAEAGDAQAQNAVGTCYNASGHGFEIDLETAAMWFERAADQKNAEAECNLGACYEHGNGVTADGTRAFALYKRAADQGLADAHYYLGKCYTNGTGIDKNPEQALVWFKSASKLGSAMAAAMLTQLASA